VFGDTLSLKRQITVGTAFGPEPLDPHPTLSLSSTAEEEWAADLMSASEPWLTLGRGRAACLEALRNPSYLLFISHNHHGQARGFLLLDPDGLAGSPYIRSVGVDPSCRGAAVGREMLQFADKLSRRNARHIFLCVSSFNARARKLYERLGYKMVGELKAYVIPGASELLMHKRLRD
jgi:[ribosomal protein S18]-alanine N-acetyltransferase